MPAPEDFFGEGCMAGQQRRVGSASAATRCTVVGLKKREMGGVRFFPTRFQRFGFFECGRRLKIKRSAGCGCCKMMHQRNAQGEDRERS
jgi:hypothetical protein